MTSSLRYSITHIQQSCLEAYLNVCRFKGQRRKYNRKQTLSMKARITKYIFFHTKEIFLNTITQNSEVQSTVGSVSKGSAFVKIHGVQMRKVVHMISVLSRIDLYSRQYLFCSKHYAFVNKMAVSCFCV